ncbi:hypothetical protein LJ656_33375 [Paraburkholderia sp. MMS20-SJTR3]|uniref:Uncharacterized protein n=1 Tax=Paraburkholderia sejongensis TaxID=2886946 RepID=A0ABS8K5L6_9BURK|nr:hypothetical protein [Paraburkholderia sp. MMS20-SJTR3]
MSPAILERVIGAFAQASPDWRAKPQVRSVDGRTVHEIVALTMLPGQTGRSAAESFGNVIEHLRGVGSSASRDDANAEFAQPNKRSRRKSEPAADEAEPDELLAQLAGSESSGRGRRARSANRTATPSGYNPFVNARPPRANKP